MLQTLLLCYVGTNGVGTNGEETLATKADIGARYEELHRKSIVL